jgi:uncharacterized protein YraI
MLTPVRGWFRDDSEPLLIINTRTPAPSPTVTPTRPRISVPLPAATLTATATAFSSPTWTATAAAPPTGTATHTPTASPTAVPTSTQTSGAPAPASTPQGTVIGDPVRLRAGPGQSYDVVGHARRGDALTVIERSSNGEWLHVGAGGRAVWILASLVEIQAGAGSIPIARDIPPTPTATLTTPPTATPTATLLPAPVLIDPPAGASFGDRVRFKFSWFRRLRHDERVSIYLRSANGLDQFDWWVSEADILAGGGAIHAQGDGYVYEVNSGLGSLPPGKAFWRIAVFVDTPAEKRQVSPGSAERPIVRK